MDGNWMFSQFVIMLQTYSEMNSQILPEMIVVGISNEDHDSRMMNCSPTTGNDPKRYSGGDEFLNFIEKELFTYIEKTYNGSPHSRSIIGQSLSGLVVMNALTRHSEMFENYLLIDGSLWFDNRLFLNNPKYQVAGKDLSNKNLYASIANTATYGSTLESIKQDTISVNRFVRHHLELIAQIEQMETGKPNLAWKYYDKDTHNSAAYLSYLDAFRFFYSWFEFKKEHNYRNKYFNPETEEDRFANLTKNQFQNVSDKLGYKFQPDENWLSIYKSSLASFQDQPEQALETYLLNKEYYPNSPSVYKDLGDFYLLQKDTIKAIESYKKILELEDISSVWKALDKIE